MLGSSGLVSDVFYVTLQQTCTVRAWDMKKPLLFCPAMNTFMWEHPITSSHVEQLVNIGYTHVPPIRKTLACGDTGKNSNLFETVKSQYPNTNSPH